MPMDHILILSSLAAATGNAETARRIAAHAKACHPVAKLTLVDACAVSLHRLRSDHHISSVCDSTMLNLLPLCGAKAWGMRLELV